jgi:hypothetical protein
MLALTSFVASAGCSLALPTPAAELGSSCAFEVRPRSRGEGSASDEPNVEPRAPRDAREASSDATERDPRRRVAGELLVRVTPTKVIAARNIAD